MLATIPNLMRGGRPHALLENVVTHRAHRRKGYGRAVVEAALQAAWNANAHHVLLMTGRTNPGVRKFYERCGFEANVKTWVCCPLARKFRLRQCHNQTLSTGAVALPAPGPKGRASENEHRFCSARLNHPVLCCRSAELVLCRASIGGGAKDGERGAECGEPVECAGGCRATDRPGARQRCGGARCGIRLRSFAALRPTAEGADPRENPALAKQSRFIE